MSCVVSVCLSVCVVVVFSSLFLIVLLLFCCVFIGQVLGDGGTNVQCHSTLVVCAASHMFRLLIGLGLGDLIALPSISNLFLFSLPTRSLPLPLQTSHGQLAHRLVDDVRLVKWVVTRISRK